jgi:MoaA/NifB/PqqE/SkfB family radical SAM enzyme
MIGDHVHWYITDECNLDCGYCFKHIFPYRPDEGRNIQLAKVLAESGVKKVTLGGGEPTLVRNLADVIGILKDSGIYVSLHTNGVLLDEDMIAGLNVDDIALPIDSADRDTQRRLRGKGFMETFERMPYLASAILENGKGLGYHMVFTGANQHDIPGIYELINEQGFDYWRIYEFNDYLAFIENINSRMTQRKKKSKQMKIEMLMGGGTPETGYTDCLLAHFFLMEQRMKLNDDERIKFVGIRDTPEPYFFLDNLGGVSYYTWLSLTKRRVAGNIIKDGFQAVRERLQEVHDKDSEFDDESAEGFNAATCGDLPPWARYDEGNFSYEELEAMRPEFDGVFMALAKLYNKRTRKNRRLRKNSRKEPLNQ